MRRIFSFIIIASTLGACKKDKNSLLVGSWKRTGDADVAAWNTPVSSVTFNAITGCYMNDIYTFTSGGVYTVSNDVSCGGVVTYNYTYNADAAELIIQGTNSSTITVAELSASQMILKSRVTGIPGVEANFRKYVRQ